MEETQEKRIVLMVDDDASFVAVLKERILSWGYACLTSSSGPEALGVLESQDVDIVILDYMMPGMDGLATLKEIRKKYKDLPVIMFTAHPDGRSLFGSRELHVNAFLPKLSSTTDASTSLKSAILLVIAQQKDKRANP
jgi:CheY-like chemotaxis protein